MVLVFQIFTHVFHFCSIMLAVFQVALLKEAKTRAGRGLRFGLGIFHGLHEGSKATPGGSWVTWGLIVTMTWLRSVPGGTHSCWQRPFAMVCKRRRCARDEMRLLGSWINCIKQSNLTIGVVYIRLIMCFLCPRRSKASLLLLSWHGSESL